MIILDETYSEQYRCIGEIDIAVTDIKRNFNWDMPAVKVIVKPEGLIAANVQQIRSAAEKNIEKLNKLLVLLDNLEEDNKDDFAYLFAKDDSEKE